MLESNCLPRLRSGIVLGIELTAPYLTASKPMANLRWRETHLARSVDSVEQEFGISLEFREGLVRRHGTNGSKAISQIRELAGCTGVFLNRPV